MHLSIVLVLALSTIGVKSHRYRQSNYYHAGDDSEEWEEQNESSLVSICECRHAFNCPYEYRDSTVSCKHMGALYVCCISVLESEKVNNYETTWPNRPSVTNANGARPWPNHQNPSHITTQLLTIINPWQPMTQDLPLATSQQMIITTQPTSPQPEVQTQLSSQIPTNNLTPGAKPHRPLLPSAQITITNTSPQAKLPSPSETSQSSNVGCACTPHFACYDEETSSNLTNVVDDRSTVPLCQATKLDKTCPDSNDVCCCNLDKPSQESQQQRPSETSPNCEGNCRSINDCSDEHVSESTLKQQGSCEDPGHVCCHELVLPISPIISVTSLNASTLSPPPQPQASSTPEIFPSASTSECKCTPFFQCFDPETSSNLTLVVDDRINQCPFNEVCCHNLSPPSGIAETGGECTGPCVVIAECPALADTLKEAQIGITEATQKLRRLACSKDDDSVRVCCQQQGVEHSTSIKFQEN